MRKKQDEVKTRKDGGHLLELATSHKEFVSI